MSSPIHTEINAVGAKSLNNNENAWKWYKTIKNAKNIKTSDLSHYANKLSISVKLQLCELDSSLVTIFYYYFSLSLLPALNHSEWLSDDDDGLGIVS